MWIVGVNGRQPRRLHRSQDNESFNGKAWLVSGKGPSNGAERKRSRRSRRRASTPATTRGHRHDARGGEQHQHGEDPHRIDVPGV